MLWHACRCARKRVHAQTQTRESTRVRARMHACVLAHASAWHAMYALRYSLGDLTQRTGGADADHRDAHGVDDPRALHRHAPAAVRPPLLRMRCALCTVWHGMRALLSASAATACFRNTVPLRFAWQARPRRPTGHRIGRDAIRWDGIGWDRMGGRVCTGLRTSSPPSARSCRHGMAAAVPTHYNAVAAHSATVFPSLMASVASAVLDGTSSVPYSAVLRASAAGSFLPPSLLQGGCTRTASAAVICYARAHPCVPHSVP
jgi:hypothetical protein